MEPDLKRREHLPDFLGAEDVQVTTVSDGREALQMLKERRIDCMVLNPKLPDMSLLTLATEATLNVSEPRLQVVVMPMPPHPRRWKRS